MTGLFTSHKPGVVEYAKNLKPSARGELEITGFKPGTTLRTAIDVGTFSLQGFTWLDTGTHESLVEATNFVKTIETHQHRKIHLPGGDRLHKMADSGAKRLWPRMRSKQKNQNGQHLKDVIDGKYIDKLPGHADK